MSMNAYIDKNQDFTGRFNHVMECDGCTPEQVLIIILANDGDKSPS